MLAVLNTVKGEFKNIYVKIPCPEVDQALLKIYQCGICGSDIQIYHGLHPFAKKPLVMGHECVAEVVRTGSGVLDLVPGDLVTVQPQIFCHTCQACRSGHSNVCENMNFMGVHTDGFFAEYAAVPAWNVLRLDHGISRDAAMLTEPVAVAVNAARKGRVMTGMRVAVVGAGTIVYGGGGFDH